MRKTILTAVGAVALATASMASAGIVTGNTGLQNVTEVDTASLITIAFEQNQLAANQSFTGVLDLTNPSNGTYSVNIGTSTPGVTFTSGTLALWNAMTSSFNTVATLGLGSTVCCGANSSIGLAPQLFTAGTYRLTFNGTSTVAGADSGTVTIAAAGAVPEPATWAMMLLGFGGIGMAMRRRRKPVLAQVA
jgi:hypothetical protein